MDIRKNKFIKIISLMSFIIAFSFISIFIYQPVKKSSSYNRCPAPSLIITSDLHLSNPLGRWPENTRHFNNFLKYLSHLKHNISAIVTVGDIIDNFDGHAAGDENYWLSEINLYKDMIKEFPQYRFYQSFGIGHDYGSISRLEMELGSSKRGSFFWEHITFIWFDINRASFPDESERYVNSMTEDEYQWLSSEIKKSKMAILLFHIPIRTKETWELGKWGTSANLTIDPRDSIYQIIRQNRDKIIAIFNGHIHSAVKSNYIGIPIYICPFMYRGSYCILTSENGRLTIDQLFYNQNK